MWGGGGVMNLEGSCWQVAQLPRWVRDLLGLLSLLFPVSSQLQAAPFLSLHLPLLYKPAPLAGAQVRRKGQSSQLVRFRVRFYPPALFFISWEMVGVSRF